MRPGTIVVQAKNFELDIKENRVVSSGCLGGGAGNRTRRFARGIITVLKNLAGLCPL